MELNLELGKHRPANLWLQDLPPARFESDQVLEFSISAAGTPLKTKRQGALEVVVPIGPRAMYGLLGGSRCHAFEDSVMHCRSPSVRGLRLALWHAFLIEDPQKWR
jgi:hypothetical protein